MEPFILDDPMNVQRREVPLKQEKPAILNMLPPSARPLTVEDLEREFASTALQK